MPLNIDGVPLAPDLLEQYESLWEKFPQLLNKAEEFKSQSHAVVVDGENGARSVCVMQGEIATVRTSDLSCNIIGSDEATTCHILVLVSRDKGVVSVGHFDETHIEQGVDMMISEVRAEADMKINDLHLEAHLVGGFLDDRQISPHITRTILVALHEQIPSIGLCNLCVTQVNDTLRGDGYHSPIIYGVAVSSRNFNIYPATFPVKTPFVQLRRSRHLSGQPAMSSVYKPHEAEFVIRPFTVDPSVERLLRYYLSLSDADLLQLYSTSPQVEPPGFVDETRKTFTLIIENIDNFSSLFPNRQGLSYKRVKDGKWEVIN